MRDTPDDVRTNESEDEEGDPGWPISFLLLVTAGGVYLILRFIAIIRDMMT
ncbi:MAG: hypothetical protein O3B42_01190 [Actinomycetota bacterium]|nr:hypothetical protein [Actinomycetota bacterium]